MGKKFEKKVRRLAFFLSYLDRRVISKDIPREEKNEVLAMKKLQWLKTKVGLFLDPRPEDRRFYATCCIESEPLYG